MWRKSMTMGALALAMVLELTTPAGAEPAPTGAIQGVVEHRAPGPLALEPVAGVTVRALGPDGVVAIAVTAADGRYRLDVPAGSYAVEYSGTGVRTEWAGGTHDANRAAAVRVLSGQALTVNPRVEHTVPPAGFVDADAPALDWARAVGLVRGYADGTIRPATAVTRAQAVTLLWRMTDTPTGAPRRRFRDVSRTAWFARALDWAITAGLTNPTANARFSPNQPVGGPELRTMIGTAVRNSSSCPIELPPGPAVSRLDALVALHSVATRSACWSRWSGPQPHTVQFDERVSTPFADGFERSDRALDRDRAPTDQIWHSYGFLQAEDPTNAGVIVGGRLATPHAGASYNWVELGAPPSEASMTFSIAPETTSGGASGLIVSSWRSPETGIAIAQHSVHVAVSSTATQISFYDGAYHDPAYTHRFAQPLVADGQTEHRLTVRRDGDTLTVTNPDGVVEIFSDPMVSSLWGSSVLVEPYRPASSWLTDGEHRIGGVSASLID